MNIKTLPEQKLNELAQRVSKQMLDNHYFEKGIIRGEDLKEFAEHKQINKFLIFQVYQVWEMQLNKLRHPYFNLDNPDIQNSLQQLRNQISQHIEISKDDFQPMLERAVFNNLKLILEPKQSFKNFFFAQKDKLPLAVYQRFTQFFSDLDFVTNSILGYYQKNEMTTVENDVFFLKMEKVIEVFNRKSDQDFDGHRVDLFRRLTGLDLGKVLAEVEEETEAVKAQKAAEEEARRQAEEAARRKTEEEKRQAEEASRQKAEEESRKAAEEARRKAEEEKRQAEEAAKKQNFFDSLENDSTDIFDLDDEELMEEEPETEEVNTLVAEVVAEEPIVVSIQEETVIEEETAELVEEAEEEVAELVEEAQEAAEEVEEELSEAVEEAVEEVVESMEETKEEVVEEVVETVEVVEEEVVIVEEAVVEVIEEEKADFDEDSFQEMAKEMEPEVAEEPVSVFDKFKPTQESKTHLDRFLQNRQNGAAKEEPAAEPFIQPPVAREEPLVEKEPEIEVEKPASLGGSIIDRHNDSGNTVADRFGTDQKKQVHDSLNGNRKIKLDEIPIHKQYQYVQKVFDGNNVRFRIIVDKVNNSKNKDEVEDILSKFVLNNEKLDQSDRVVGEFITMLRNRF